MGTKTLNDSSPMPKEPTMWWVSSLPAAAHMGGHGFWSGLGITRRRGIDQYSPSKLYSSFIQQPAMCSTASVHMARVSLGSMPKPSSSARLLDRPVPNSTRPPLITSRVAADSAERTGWL